MVVILGILATGAIPSFRQIIRRTELKEVRNVVEAVISGARHYELKRGNLTTLTTASPDCWYALNVELPDNPFCTYAIVIVGGTGRRLNVYSPSAQWLYRYYLPRGPGAINGANPDAKYVQDLP